MRHEKAPIIEKLLIHRNEAILKRELKKRRRQIRFKATNILVSPVKAVRDDFQDRTLDFIICSDLPFPTAVNQENVLILRFLDIENELSPLAFQPEDASKIIRFLSRNNANKDLFVCCDGGVSRSPAIAAAVSLAIGKSDMPIWESAEYHPNRLVFQRLCWAFGIPMYPSQIKERTKVMEKLNRFLSQ